MKRGRRLGCCGLTAANCRSAVEQRLAALGLLDATVRPGFMLDARALLPAMDVYLHLARWEGVPYAVMEAMWAGVPVVGADAIGTTDLIADEQTGLLVSGGDGPAAGRAALRLLTEAPLARNITQGCGVQHAAAAGSPRHGARHRSGLPRNRADKLTC